MEIPNLATQSPLQETPKIAVSWPLIIIIISVALASGFFISRFVKVSSTSVATIDSLTKNSTDSISDATQLEIGKVYGNTAKTFKDTATGVIEKGNINGEGTHILVREGGASQRASLTSSAVDLDLFVGKKVEIKGETNASTKTSWLLDVGSIKILQ